MEPNVPEWTVRRAALGTLVVLGVAAGFAVLYWAGALLATLFLAILLGTAVKPAVDWMERHGVARVAGTAGVYILLTALIAVFIVAVVPLLVRQLASLLDELPAYYGRLRATLAGSSLALGRAIGGYLPASLTDLPIGGGRALPLIGRAFRQAAIVGHGLWLAVAIVVLGFYWTLEGDRTLRTVLRLLPQERREGVRGLLAESERRVGRYVRGLAVLSVIIGVLSFLAYTLIGLPNAIVFAVLAGVLEVVPYIGPILSAIPPLLVALTIDPMTALWVLVACVIIQQSENYFLVPLVMRGSVGLNPFVTLLAITAFGSLLGVLGVLLAVPLAGILQVLVERLRPHAPDVEPEQPPLTALRVEAQRLAIEARERSLAHPPAELGRPADAVQSIDDAVEEVASDLDRALARLELVRVPVTVAVPREAT